MTPNADGNSPQTLILPILGIESIDESLARLTFVDIGEDGERIIPIFSTEETFLAHRPIGSEGLVLDPDVLVQVLQPSDIVALDAGTEYGTRWTMPEFIAMLLVATETHQDGLPLQREPSGG